MAPHRRRSALVRLVLVTAGLLSAALLACAPTPSPVDDARHPDPPRPPLVVPTAPGPTPRPRRAGPPRERTDSGTPSVPSSTPNPKASRS